jgi:hypothetical protein
VGGIFPLNPLTKFDKIWKIVKTISEDYQIKEHMNTKKEGTNTARKRVSISLSTEEFLKLQAVASSEHLSPTAYIKKLASTDLKSKTGVKDQSDEPARNRVWIYLTDKENKKLEVLSDKQGVKKSTLAKNILIKTIQEGVFIPDSVQKELDKLHYLISNIANNVNQMAWHSNRFRQLLDETPVLIELQKLNTDVREFIKSRLKR